MNALRRAMQPLAIFFSWVLFGSVSLVLNFACAILLLLPGHDRHGPAARTTIRRLFGAWCGWLHATGLVYVTWVGFTPGRLAGPAVYIANHPGLLDATFILARLPDTICIFKPSVIHNPALGPAAILAEYASGDAGVDLIRDVAGRVADGRSLLIFPEGTRTVRGQDLNTLKPGFAVIAARAEVPVRLILVRAPRNLLPKGAPWWSMKAFPARVEVTLLGELDAGVMNAAELTAVVAQQLSAALGENRSPSSQPATIEGVS